MIKQNNDYKVLNVATGEIYDIRLHKEQRGGLYMIVLQDAMKYIATTKMRGETRGVLLYLLGALKFENGLPPINKVAIAMQIARPSVSRAFRELQQHSVLIKEDNVYLLNPAMFWKGTIKAQRAAIERLKSKGIKL